MMNKSFHPILSEEKFAAWLDGMLPTDEMQQIGSIISNDSDLHSLLGVSDYISAHNEEPMSVLSNLDNNKVSLFLQDALEFPALEALQLSPIDTDLSNGLFPTFIPDNLITDESNILIGDDTTSLETGFDDYTDNI